MTERGGPLPCSAQVRLPGCVFPIMTVLSGKRTALTPKRVYRKCAAARVDTSDSSNADLGQDSVPPGFGGGGGALS